MCITNPEEVESSIFSIKNYSWGAWVAQLVKCPTSAQVMILQFVELEPHTRLCADSSEPGAGFTFCVSPSLCLSPTHVCVCSLSLSLAQK